MMLTNLWFLFISFSILSRFFFMYYVQVLPLTQLETQANCDFQCYDSESNHCHLDEKKWTINFMTVKKTKELTSYHNLSSPSAHGDCSHPCQRSLMSKCIAKDMEGKHMADFESVNRISANTFSDVLMYYLFIWRNVSLISWHQKLSENNKSPPGTEKKNISLITIFSLRM